MIISKNSLKSIQRINRSPVFPLLSGVKTIVTRDFLWQTFHVGRKTPKHSGINYLFFGRGDKVFDC